MTSSAISVSPTHRKMQSAFSRDLLRRFAEGALFLGGELARLFGRVGPEPNLVTGAEQVARHRIAHQAESKKSQFCHRVRIIALRNRALTKSF